MSLIGINGVSGATRVALPATASAATPNNPNLATDARTAAPDAVQTEESDDKVKPVHFPWLSRLSAGLEAASNKRSLYPTQIMGDNVNQTA